MIFGRTQTQKDEVRKKNECVFYAYLPKKLSNGLWVWLEYYFEEHRYKELGYQTFTIVRRYQCKVTYEKVES